MTTEKYETRIVAFIDVLGWRQMVDASASDPELLQKLTLTSTMLNRRYGQIGGVIGKVEMFGTTFIGTNAHGNIADFQIGQFSDSLIVSASARKYSISNFIWKLALLNQSLFYSETFLRGGITVGPMIHSGSLALGPALTRAYDIESQVASSPRIVIDPAAVDLIRKRPFTADSMKRRRPIAETRMLRLDEDGFWFLDFLMYAHRWDPTHELFHPILDNPRVHLDRAKSIIEKHMAVSRSDVRVYPKYAWLGRYYNSCAAELTMFGIEPINIDANTA